MRNVAIGTGADEVALGKGSGSKLLSEERHRSWVESGPNLLLAPSLFLQKHAAVASTTRLRPPRPQLRRHYTPLANSIIATADYSTPAPPRCPRPSSTFA